MSARGKSPVLGGPELRVVLKSKKYFDVVDGLGGLVAIFADSPDGGQNPEALLIHDGTAIERIDQRLRASDFHPQQKMTWQMKAGSLETGRAGGVEIKDAKTDRKTAAAVNYEIRSAFLGSS